LSSKLITNLIDTALGSGEVVGLSVVAAVVWD